MVVRKQLGDQEEDDDSRPVVDRAGRPSAAVDVGAHDDARLGRTRRATTWSAVARLAPSRYQTSQRLPACARSSPPSTSVMNACGMSKSASSISGKGYRLPTSSVLLPVAATIAAGAAFSMRDDDSGVRFPLVEGVVLRASAARGRARREAGAPAPAASSRLELVERLGADERRVDVRGKRVGAGVEVPATARPASIRAAPGSHTTHGNEVRQRGSRNDRSRSAKRRRGRALPGPPTCRSG